MPKTLSKTGEIYPTDIEDTKLRTESLLYPNPNNGRFNLKMDNHANADIYLEIYGMNGQIVFFNKFNGGNGIIDIPIQLENVNKGVYILKVFDGEKYEIKKFMIK